MKSIPILRISVIIPFFNRFDSLQMTLNALEQQTLPVDEFEAILVDDGSTDDLTKVIKDKERPYNIISLKQAHRGPAAARNTGARHASGEVLLFLDSDMIAEPSLLEQHLESHKMPRRLVVGLRHRFSGNEADRFDQFDYRPDGTDPRLDRVPITFQEAFTCNLSIKAEIWKSLQGFDERYQTQSFEDIEFAYRCATKGLEIYLNPKAVAYHYHTLTFENRCKKTISYTQTVPLLFLTHPELRGRIEYLRDKEPINLKSDSPQIIVRKIARMFLALPPVLGCMKWVLRNLEEKDRAGRLLGFFYWKIIGSYQLIGLQRGYRLYGQNQ